ncbi:hypothetical protein JI435_411250 [Parastagonospora nodorum SN15]|uniref:Uncharacterized protein n=1 Tax=Phaeosphaeria nodorum (strain SN15 / ATCC MYA-4574 / FGSC 10173) TaxID=321614 RepID=A0A7U2HZR2_PHANO|nr:hypothetical protein HBI71_010940 [Parastagonospora nodorum]KAH6008719.1 hypothetical protein HBI83_173080 [Parastagonospora nodorum]QRC97920.1 hypothetical protein JI435_411250 [Parastagonospora nodorum SN15]
MAKGQQQSVGCGCGCGWMSERRRALHGRSCEHWWSKGVEEATQESNGQPWAWTDCWCYAAYCVESRSRSTAQSGCKRLWAVISKGLGGGQPIAADSRWWCPEPEPATRGNRSIEASCI